MAKLRYTRRAREDLFDVWLYIASRNSDAFADAIYDRIDLAQHPQLGRARPEIAPDARALVIERWLAVYRLTGNGVLVVRAIDGAHLDSSARADASLTARTPRLYAAD